MCLWSLRFSLQRQIQFQWHGPNIFHMPPLKKLKAHIKLSTSYLHFEMVFRLLYCDIDSCAVSEFNNQDQRRQDAAFIFYFIFYTKSAQSFITRNQPIIQLICNETIQPVYCNQGWSCWRHVSGKHCDHYSGVMCIWISMSSFGKILFHTGTVCCAKCAKICLLC